MFLTSYSVVDLGGVIWSVIWFVRTDGTMDRDEKRYETHP